MAPSAQATLVHPAADKIIGCTVSHETRKNYRLTFTDIIVLIGHHYHVHHHHHHHHCYQDTLLDNSIIKTITGRSLIYDFDLCIVMS